MTDYPVKQENGITNDKLVEHDAETLSNEEFTQECQCYVNRGLVPSKLFYFFFFAANGTLIPYLILFFKQLGLSPSQVGIVSGTKPFISFVFSPIWGYIADKTKQTRIIYILSLMAYIGGYFAYSFAPAKHVCKLQTNSTKHDPSPLVAHMHVHKRFLGNESLFFKNSVLFSQKFVVNTQLINVKTKRNLLSLDQHVKGKLTRNTRLVNNLYVHVKNKSKERRDKLISVTTDDDHSIYPSFYTEGMDTSFFQMPATVNFLSFKEVNSKNKSSKSSVKHSFAKKRNLTDLTETNDVSKVKSITYTWSDAVNFRNSPWTVCAAAKANLGNEINFAEQNGVQVDLKSIFLYLLIVTLVATVFSCPLITIVDTATIRKLKEDNSTHKYGKQRLWGSLGWGISSFSIGIIISTLPLCPGMNNEVNYYPAFYVFAIFLMIALVIGLKLKFSEKHSTEPQPDIMEVNRAAKVFNGLKLLKKPVYFYFILTSFYIGIVMSIIKTFLFWHLKDIGGTQLLFSLISAVNCCAEVFVYFFSSTFIKRVGHIRVLYIALVCYSLRLFYYGLLTNPWYVLAAEPLSGITTAAAWSAMTSYVGLNASTDSATTLQGILHGVHWGLGHGCGELLGGFLVSWVGAAMTFNIFGATTILKLLFFIIVNSLGNKELSESNQKEVSYDYIPVTQE